MTRATDIEFIDTPEHLADFVQSAAAADFLAVDTEFIREKTYWPELCLVQIMAGERLACIDTLALQDDNLAPLRERLLDPNQLKVFHAARQDLEVFYYLWEALPAPVFDTQVAAAMLGHGDQVGYANLVQALLGVELAKGHTRTDWRARPLPEEAITYAADDVRYLVEVYCQLRDTLAGSERLEWLGDEFQQLTDPALYRPDPANAWKRVKGHNRLRPRQLGILMSLAEWREEQALSSNRPRKWILKDSVLLDLSRNPPAQTEDMGHHRDLPDRVRERHGEELLKRIELGREREAPRLQRPVPLEPHQEAVVDALMALLRARCAEHDMSPAQVATRKHLEALVRGETDIPLLRGWRHRMAGRDMQAFLRGEAQLACDKGGLVARSET